MLYGTASLRGDVLAFGGFWRLCFACNDERSRITAKTRFKTHPGREVLSEIG